MWLLRLTMPLTLLKSCHDHWIDQLSDIGRRKQKQEKKINFIEEKQ